MKMNSLDALFSLLARLDVEDDDRLAAHHPHVYAERVSGKSVAEVGGIPILHMRAFGKEKKLPQALVEDVMTRARRAAPRV